MKQKPLTPKQRAAIGRQAAAAYKRQQQHDLHDGLSSQDWIRREAVVACGSRISEALNAQFEALMRHFCLLAGETGKALEIEMKNTPEDREKGQLLWAMMKLLTETLRVPTGTDPRPAARQYLKTIVKQQFGNALDPTSPTRPEDCTVEQLRNLRFTVVNRCRAMKEKELSNDEMRDRSGSGTTQAE
jgi:hypothetical protein